MLNHESILLSQYLLFMNIRRRNSKKKHLIFKINVNNKQVRTLLNNENEANLINNILACIFEITTFKFEQFISLYFKNKKISNFYKNNFDKFAD